MRKQYFILVFVAISLCGSAQEKQGRGFIPHHAKLQFAGSIGFVSAGVGYENRKRSIEGDVYYGYVPKKFGGITMHAVTGKATFYPFKEKKYKGFQWRPLSAGVLASYTFGKQYFLFAPGNYPYNYYGFPTALHAGVFVGGQLSTTFNKKSLRAVGLYYEVGTNDKELVSYFGNNSLQAKDILNLAIGIKTTF